MGHLPLAWPVFSSLNSAYVYPSHVLSIYSCQLLVFLSSDFLGRSWFLDLILQILEGPVWPTLEQSNLIFLPMELMSSATIVGLEQALPNHFHECILQFPVQYFIHLSQCFVQKLFIASFMHTNQVFVRNRKINMLKIL